MSVQDSQPRDSENVGFQGPHSRFVVHDGDREVTITESEWILDARKATVALAQKGDAYLAKRLRALGWMHRDDGLDAALALVSAEVESMSHASDPVACVAQGKLEVARYAIEAAKDLLKATKSAEDVLAYRENAENVQDF